MLEWYRAYEALPTLVEDIQSLLCELNEKEFITDPVGEVQKHSLSQLFLKFTGRELTPSTTKAELIEHSQALSQPVDPEDSWNNIFHLIFIGQIEPHLGQGGPELIYNFPPSQAALACINEEGWADRFELYWRGFEIGNAFNELRDPIEQQARFHTEMALREEEGKVPIPIDEEFIVALKQGLPPCVGMAIGLERLFLACQNMNDLSQLRLFPFQGL